MSDADGLQSARAGWALLSAGNARGAVRQFSDALTANPKNADALAGLAQGQLNLGELPAARQSIDALLRVLPNGAAGHRLSAEVLRRQKSFRAAIAAAREAVALDPRQPYGYHVLALCLLSGKQRKAALKVCDEGLVIAPGHAVLHAQRGELLLVMRGPKAAQPSIEAALRLAPQSSYVLRKAASLAIARNELAQARDILTIVLRRNANDRDAVTLYLLTDPKRHRLLRAMYIFGCWRAEHRILGPAASWGLWFLFLLITLPLAIATHGALLLALGIRFFLKSKYTAHRKEVQAHFAKYAFNEAF